MKLYGIRRKSDGFMMPAGRSRGFTHDEPKDPCLFPPRLFSRSHLAQAALREWLKGEISVSWYTNFLGEGDYDFKIEPRLNRKPEDMEVVTVYLRVKKP